MKVATLEFETPLYFIT